MTRKSLRKKIVEILKAANNTMFGQNVFPNRSIPTNVDTLPVVLVYSRNAPVDVRDESPKSYIIQQDIVIECISQHDDDGKLSDEIDDISEAVIAIIEDSFELEENCEHVTLSSIMMDTEGEGQSPIGSVRITYSIGLNFVPRQSLILDDLFELENNFKMNDNENNDAKDVIEFPAPEPEPEPEPEEES